VQLVASYLGGNVTTPQDRVSMMAIITTITAFKSTNEQKKALFARYVQPYFKETKSESVTHLISTIQYYSIILEWLIAGFEIIPPQFAEHILPMVIAALDITNRADLSYCLLNIIISPAFAPHQKSLFERLSPLLKKEAGELHVQKKIVQIVEQLKNDPEMSVDILHLSNDLLRMQKWILIREINDIAQRIISNMTEAEIEFIYDPIFQQNDRKLLARLPSVLKRLIENKKYQEMIVSILIESAQSLENIDSMFLIDILTGSVSLVVKYIQPIIALITKMYAAHEQGEFDDALLNDVLRLAFVPEFESQLADETPLIVQAALQIYNNRSPNISVYHIRSVFMMIRHMMQTVGVASAFNGDILQLAINILERALRNYIAWGIVEPGGSGTPDVYSDWNSHELRIFFVCFASTQLHTENFLCKLQRQFSR
jgi:hypothetical protein